MRYRFVTFHSAVFTLIRPKRAPDRYGASSLGMTAPGPNLEELRRNHPWCWVICERYLHRRPVALDRSSSDGAGGLKQHAAPIGVAPRVPRFSIHIIGLLYPQEPSTADPLRRSSAMVESRIVAVAWRLRASATFPIPPDHGRRSPPGSPLRRREIALLAKAWHCRLPHAAPC